MPEYLIHRSVGRAGDPGSVLVPLLPLLNHRGDETKMESTITAQPQRCVVGGVCGFVLAFCCPNRATSTDVDEQMFRDVCGAY